MLYYKFAILMRSRKSSNYFKMSNIATMTVAIGVVFLLIAAAMRILSSVHVGESAASTTILAPTPSWPYTNLGIGLGVGGGADVLRNPYVPPLRDERYVRGWTGWSVPVNVPTNIGQVDAEYRQLGMLTSLNASGGPNGANRLLPLMGRPLIVTRDKWNYYSMTDSGASIKLPVSRAGRSCTNEYGCDKLYTGDTVYVDGLNDVYRVTLYDNDTIRYLPW